MAIRALQALSEEKAEALFKYQALFDSNMLAIACTDFNDSILDANDAFLSMLGYSREDLEAGALRWSTISPARYNKEDIIKMNELLQHKTIVPFEKEYIHKDGRAVPVLVGAEAFDAEISFGVCFALDISEMKELERKKDDFIGLVSHELKTPLAIMKLQSEFLRAAIVTGSKKEQMEFAKEIEEHVDKLGILISDLLNMARYHSAEYAPNFSAVDLGDIAQKVVHDLSLYHDMRAITCEAKGRVYVRGNGERLSQVLINLVNNAVRYSPQEEAIDVRAYKEGDMAILEVTDKGIGIDREDAERIFERYYRVNNADKHKEAAGLGLYVCSEIVKQHKGKIEVLSKKGKGSTFRIVLPRVA